MLAALGIRSRIAWAMPWLEGRRAVFDQLRTNLHLGDDELPRGSRPRPPAGPEPTAAAAHLQLIETAAKTYHDQLGRQFSAQRHCRTGHRAEAVALANLDRCIDG